MKLKDIKVGEEYAVGSENYAHRVRVLEVGEVEREKRLGTGWSRITKMETVKGARMVHVRDDGSPAIGWDKKERQEVVLPAQVLRPWSEHVKKKAAQEEGRAAGERLRREREAAFEAATGVSICLGTDNGARLNGYQLQAIIDLVASLRVAPTDREGG